MQIADLWRTSRFRLTLVYGAMFAAGVILLLGMIYWQTAGYMAGQVNQILKVEARSFSAASPEALPTWIRQDMTRDARHINLYGLFSPDGVWIVGNVQKLPADMPIGGPPREAKPGDGLPPGARALAIRMPWREVLVLGRDATQLVEIRGIILRALLWSGAAIVILALGLAAALSVNPLRRVQAIRGASRQIMDGKLTERLPISGRRDELDMLAMIVNAMLDEVQRLVGEVKSASDSLAHDLRTPLTRLRALLYRIEQQPDLAEAHRTTIAQALGETDTLLGRFRALLRVSEIESRERRAGFASVDLQAILQQIRALYEPLASERGVGLKVDVRGKARIEADAELMFEALSNVVDNAIKFSPAGGEVLVRLVRTPQGPRLEVADSGPGVPAEERAAVLQRFYRSARDQSQPGSGLGLSIVAAIVRLHEFGLELEDAGPGLRVALNCWPRWAA